MTPAIAAPRSVRWPGRCPAGGETERGVVLVWVALLLTVLLGFTAWAVDYGHWLRERTRMQKAADAAALAGAVFMPENSGGIAFTTARQVAARNGYPDGVGGISVAVSVGAYPNQLRVRITRTVQNRFAQVVGFATTTLRRTAVAEYQRAVSMGSPSSRYGNDPEPGGPYPDFWGNVFGPASSKQKGDAIQSRLCIGTVDNCAGTNTDYDPNGYFYAVEVQSTASPLRVQAFDPAFAHVGDNCGPNNGGSNLAGAAALPPNFNPVFPVPDPAVRYDPAATSRYCTGDQFFTDQAGNTQVPWTTWRVLGPDDTPGDPSDNPQVCAVEFPGYRGDLVAALTATTPQAGAPGVFAAYFRQWYTLCTIPTPQVGTYFVQVQTATRLNGSPAPFGGGANRWALRATLAGSGSGVRLYGWGRMGIYANSPAANTSFHLARVLPGSRGRTLVLTFFDVGDAAQAGTITVLPPPDANLGPAFAGCTYTPPPGPSSGPPWGAFTPTAPGCAITNVHSSTYNGQWIQVRIPIPDTYTCDHADPFGCWTRIRFAYPAAVQDTTTWTAQMTGDPVRIIE